VAGRLLLRRRIPGFFHPFQGQGSAHPARVEVYDAALSYHLRLPPGQLSAVTREVLMNRLAAILPASNVLVNVDATSKKRVFEQAGLLFENQHAIARGTVTDNLFARERLGSTGLGHAVAIPHGRIKGLKNPLAAVVRVQQPIPFDAPDDEAVALLIFLLVPEAATQRHLEILSEIAEMLSDRELRERLKTEPDAAGVHKLISDWEPLKSVA
jgi:nitrogen PTS system EIIA component